MYGHLVAVEMLDEGSDAAVVLEGIGTGSPFVLENDPDTGIQEGQLAQALGEDLVVKIDMAEDLGAGPETDGCASRRGITDGGQGGFGLAEMFVFIAVLLAALVYVWRKGDLQWD